MAHANDYDGELQIDQWENEGGALAPDCVEALHVPPIFLDIQRRLAAVEAFISAWQKPLNADLPSA